MTELALMGEIRDLQGSVIEAYQEIVECHGTAVRQLRARERMLPSSVDSPQERGEAR